MVSHASFAPVYSPVQTSTSLKRASSAPAIAQRQGDLRCYLPKAAHLSRISRKLFQPAPDETMAALGITHLNTQSLLLRKIHATVTDLQHLFNPERKNVVIPQLTNPQDILVSRDSMEPFNSEYLPTLQMSHGQEHLLNGVDLSLKLNPQARQLRDAPLKDQALLNIVVHPPVNTTAQSEREVSLEHEIGKTWLLQLQNNGLISRQEAEQARWVRTPYSSSFSGRI
jgi:hypothetical protein